jgi:hypothetical protein
MGFFDWLISQKKTTGNFTDFPNIEVFIRNIKNYINLNIDPLTLGHPKMVKMGKALWEKMSSCCEHVG